MKGNPILGTGSGSIGDVTVMRRNGSQVTRVRLRKIKNPMSQGQAEQRMYMAPILKFYSPLSKVLETSFEGLNKADSYAKFISVNANLARANGWAVKKGSGLIVLPYKIAGGTLPTPYVGDNGLKIGENENTPTTWGQISTILKNYYGLEDGDQVTFISFAEEDEQTFMKNKRFFIDSTNSDSLTTLGLTADSSSVEMRVFPNGQSNFACAIIFSRWSPTNEKWLRSDSYMTVSRSYLANYTGAEKLAAAIASYMKSAGQTPVSDVYLNGSDD